MKSKEKQKTFEHTARTRAFYETLKEIERVKDIMYSKYGKLFCRISTEDILGMSREYGEAKARFWEEVGKNYPLTKNAEATANSFGITLLE